jgi:putative ABC transport system substrate-binding protein
MGQEQENQGRNLMRMKVFGFALSAVILALSFSAEAQQPKKVFRIGFLSALSPKPGNVNVDAFREALRALGWVEGQDIAIEYRWAEGKYDRLPELAAELIRLKVDVIVTNASRAAVAAKQATSIIPVVFEVMGEPVSMGLVASLARPGGNLTGVSSFGSELSGKQVELIKEVVPGLTRLAVLANHSSVGATAVIRETEMVAKALGVQPRVFNVDVPDKIDAAFAAMAKQRANALLVPADAMLATQHKRILVLVENARLPAMYVETPLWVADGGAHELFRKPARPVSQGSHLCGQDSERSKACRFAGTATDEIRADDQSERRQADWLDDSTERASTGDQNH